MSTTGFLKFIAYLQIMGIILVVFAHSLYFYPDGEHGRSCLLNALLHNVRMPLFMFVSGFLMYYTSFLKREKAKPWRTFAMSKVKRLLLPFFVLTLVTFFPRSMMSGMAEEEIQMTLSGFINSFIHTNQLVIPFFWFIQASFVLLVFTYACIVLARKWHINDAVFFIGMVALFVLLEIAPFTCSDFWSLQFIIVYGLFFELGVLYCRYADTIDRYVRWTNPWLILLITAVWIASYLITRGTPWMHISSIIGIAMSIGIAKWLVKHDYHFLDHLVGANYIIFLLSWYFNVLCQQVLSHFVKMPWWGYSVLSFIAGLYIPWLFYKYMLRHPESRFVKISAYLLGQSLNKKK